MLTPLELTKECENAQQESRNRLRSQINQRRYRQRKKEAQKNLEMQVVQLRKSTVGLMENLRLIRILDGSAQKASGVAYDYHKIFEYGLRQAIYDQQANFLRKTMSPSLRIMDNFEVDGATKILEQLQLYTSLFDSHHLRLEHIENIFQDEDEVVIKTIGLLTLRLSRLSVATLFPNIIGKQEALVQELIGKSMVIRFVNHFCVGRMSGKVESLSSTTNITSATINLLGNIDQGLLALENSAIKSNGELVVPQSWQ
ncbi:hypothetical protein THRCLA_09906 [Thraustotheca clavata]|uniref:BZIP domain-containing protein n=1 Tax=Thraustotheca clavata TaxID=74557 RepID=A0A1V9YU64_9STRA|nr:hypothetical protein THRCLA_09906 [Thraustotheca clavata]